MPALHIEDFGAIYGNIQPEQYPVNDQAIAAALAKAASVGGGIVIISDQLRLSRPVIFPTVTFNGVPGFPSSVGLAGDGLMSALIWPPTMDQPGIVINTPYINPANYPYGDLRMRVCNLALYQAGIKITNAGKALMIDNVNISGLQGAGSVGLDVSTYDGGYLYANVHDCAGIGVRLAAADPSQGSAHMTQVRLTSRYNQVGVQTIGCGGLDGYLYTESNRAYNQDHAGLNRSRLHIWMENGGRAFQGKRRRCYANVFTGQWQQASGQGWDDDPVSASCNYSCDFGELMYGRGVQTFAYSTLRTNYPASDVQVAGQSITVHPAAFANHTPNLWVQLQPDITCPWQPGDFFVIELAIEIDDLPTLQWLMKQRGPLLRVGVNDPKIAQNVWPCGYDSTTRVAIPGLAAGSGQIPAIYLFPAVANGPPPIDLQFSVSATLGYLRNQTTAEPSA